MRHFAPFRPAPRRLAACCLAGAVAALAGIAHAQLPVEQLSMEKLQPPDAYRIYLSDPALAHIVDGRTHIVDGTGMRYLGMLGTGFAGQTAVSRDQRSIYVATSYYSRLQRGTRTDVVEVYSAEDLALQHEIEIPPKHVQGLPMRAVITTTPDDRFLLVQNATPATSVTVVDLQAKKTTAEIPTPGCYGVIPWPARPRRFSSVCGDGTLASYDIDDKGAAAGNRVSAAFFDPDKDPVFMHYDLVGNTLRFVSYLGSLYAIDLSGDEPVAAKPVPLVDAASAKQGWRPGGYQLFAVEPRSARMFLAMHDKGVEGSHKSPAKEIWVIDLKTMKRVGRLPGETAVAMAVARTDKPRLFVLSGADNRILSYDIAGDKLPAKPALRSEPFGDMPIYLGLAP